MNQINIETDALNHFSIDELNLEFSLVRLQNFLEK